MITKSLIVDDEIVSAIVLDRIQTIEQQKKGWIINGFPRTRAQAMMLQKWGVVPDRIISSSNRKKQIMQRMQVQCLSSNQNIGEEEVPEITKRMFAQYESNHKEVLETFGEFVFKYDIKGKNQSEGANDLCTMLKLRFQQSVVAKRRPPKIFLVGPPGSGRSTQAAEMHRIYGLVNVSL
jgi:adenylate kinase